MQKDGVEKHVPRPLFLHEVSDIDIWERRREEEKEERREQRYWDLLIILTVIFAIALFYTLTLFVLQAFHVGGFDLETRLLELLGGSTIGEVAGLLVILIRGLSSSSEKAQRQE